MSVCVGANWSENGTALDGGGHGFRYARAMPQALKARITVDLRDLRIAGTVMLAAGAILPLVPGPDGIPCPLRSLTGVPCPLCGMTTSVTAALHLHVGAAARTNPAGLLTIAAALWLLADRRAKRITMPAWTAPAVLGIMWAWELARFGLLRA